MDTHPVIHDFKKFVDWFSHLDYHQNDDRRYVIKGNCIALDLEAITDEHAVTGKQFVLPFTDEEIEAWQKSGLIVIETVMDCYNFKPSRKITLNYRYIADDL